MDEEAKQIFLSTRNAMGFNAPEWEELPPETKQIYYDATEAA